MAVIRTDFDLIFIKNEHSDDCSVSAEVFDIIDLMSGLKRKAENSITSFGNSLMMQLGLHQLQIRTKTLNLLIE